MNYRSESFGAYSSRFNWLNLASIRATEDGVRAWARDNINVTVQKEWVIIPVTVSAKIPEMLRGGL